ncbi:MAG: hypothetical protein ACC628_16175 [Pirellulaceae bacterium]
MAHLRLSRSAVAWIMALAVATTTFGQSVPTMSLEGLKKTRRDLAHRPRRVIMNNDGCEVLYYPDNEEVTVENLLAKRTTALAGTHVDTIAFCPTSSGFSFFTHNTSIGTILTRSGPEFGIQPGTRNIAKELIDLGTDCMQAVTAFGHRHDMEVFWSMRMNDTHDAAHRPDKPYLLFPPLKVKHPEWLVGDYIKRTPHGRWSSVDYARSEIRNLAFNYLEEVCVNYDIDGVELDFFRHLCYFKDPALGGTATDEQREMMTQLIRRVRTMTEEVGLRRGRPILVAIRVPDSIGFCRDMGFDLECWMQEQLIDMLITTGYFRLNPWEYSVELGHRYGVPVYPCLSDSRVRGETRFRRSSIESYRGRAMNAWGAGADGLHVFNAFDPHAEMWSEIGDPKSLLATDKLYFVNVRDGDPRSWLAKGREYRTVSLFGPSHPQLVTTGEPLNLEMVIGDDIAAAQSQGLTPDIKLHVEVPTLRKSEQLHLAFNGIELDGGVLNAGWIDYPVPASAIKPGKNEVTLRAEPDVLQPDEWAATYDGSSKPDRVWHRDRGSVRTKEENRDGALFIADQGKVSGDYLYYRYPWGADPEGEAVVEARVKVKSGSSFIIITNGASGERLGLWPDRIELYHHKNLRYTMDTTDDFHCYRLELRRQDLKVYVDGTLRIDAAGALAPRSGYSRNEICFGAANSGMVGEAYWDDVKARASGLACSDLVVSVSYAK